MSTTISRISEAHQFGEESQELLMQWLMGWVFFFEILIFKWLALAVLVVTVCALSPGLCRPTLPWAPSEAEWRVESTGAGALRSWFSHLPAGATPTQSMCTSFFGICTTRIIISTGSVMMVNQIMLVNPLTDLAQSGHSTSQGLIEALTASLVLGDIYVTLLSVWALTSVGHKLRATGC